MLVCLGKIPIAIYKCSIRIICTKGTVWHSAHPYIILIMLPTGDTLCSCNNCFQWLCTLICNACIWLSCKNRIHILTIYTRCYKHCITWFCDLCCLINTAKWHFLASISITSCTDININIHIIFSFQY